MTCCFVLFTVLWRMENRQDVMVMVVHPVALCGHRVTHSFWHAHTHLDVILRTCTKPCQRQDAHTNLYTDFSTLKSQDWTVSLHRGHRALERIMTLVLGTRESLLPPNIMMTGLNLRGVMQQNYQLHHHATILNSLYVDVFPAETGSQSDSSFLGSPKL